jgi:hypothetical protein
MNRGFNELDASQGYGLKTVPVPVSEFIAALEKELDFTFLHSRNVYRHRYTMD